MRGTVRFEIDGRACSFCLTIGALEEIQAGGFKPGVVFAALSSNIYEIAELMAVLRAGLDGATAEEVVDELGLGEAARIATEGMNQIFTPKKDRAPDEPVH